MIVYVYTRFVSDFCRKSAIYRVYMYMYVTTCSESRKLLYLSVPC